MIDCDLGRTEIHFERVDIGSTQQIAQIGTDAMGNETLVTFEDLMSDRTDVGFRVVPSADLQLHRFVWNAGNGPAFDLFDNDQTRLKSGRIGRFGVGIGIASSKLPTPLLDEVAIHATTPVLLTP